MDLKKDKLILTFDKNKISANFSVLDDILCEAVASFINTWPSVLSAIELSIKNKDSKSLIHEAHTLKGMVSSFYAEKARLLAYELEKMGRQSDFSMAQGAFLDLDSEIKQLSESLQIYVEKRISR